MTLQIGCELTSRNGAQGRHSSTTVHTTAQAGNTTTPPTAQVVFFATKKAEDAWLSWQCGKQDPTIYPILENDRGYADWIINTELRFKSERCERMIDGNFLDNMVVGNADIALYKAQQNHISIVLDCVKKHRNYPQEIGRLHDKHQRS